MGCNDEMIALQFTRTFMHATVARDARTHLTIKLPKSCWIPMKVIIYNLYYHIFKFWKFGWEMLDIDWVRPTEVHQHRTREYGSMGRDAHLTALLAALKMAAVVAMLTGPHPNEQLLKQAVGERVPTHMTYVCAKEWQLVTPYWDNS